MQDDISSPVLSSHNLIRHQKDQTGAEADAQTLRKEDVPVESCKRECGHAEDDEGTSEHQEGA